jgi:hypothetical protein
LGDTTWLYNQNGTFLGVINDKLKNQVHYINRDDPGTPFDASKLSAKEAKELAKSFRKESFAFMGSKTASDMRKIVGQAVGNRKEVGFVGTVGKDKEIRLSALPIDEGNAKNSLPLNSQIDKMYPSAEQQSNLILSGHTHIAAYVDGFTTVDGLPISNLKQYGNPTVPGDYKNNLYRGKDATEKGRTPALVTTPYGVVVYGTEPNGVYGKQNSYILYKSLK